MAEQWATPQPIQTVVHASGAPANVVPGQFAAGLCDCCDPGCGTCCYACCCASCAFGDLAVMLEFDDHCCGGSWGGACFFHYMMGGFFSGVVMYLTGIYLPTVNWVAGGPVRTAIRTKYQLQGGVCSDCLLAWCCDPCTIVQQSKELRLRASAPATNLVMLHPGLVVQAHPVQPMNASSQPRTQDRDGHVVQHPFSANTSQVELG
eukprot:TRINITY_DN7841_c0_g1_i1.p1 TRINITY_DN7841_c0_g1~~TRINITY_DN7841_c0_g1_i1.p1  ORF type:complete len:205 (-),score=10.51 TRINITY_DN7841_c0_g1_i1:410-1024(-)